MKLRELLAEEAPKVVEGDVYVPPTTIHLNYHNTIVKGTFHCNGTQIKTLDGSPIETEKSFYCFDTGITSLRGSPRKVGEIYSCVGCPITSLEGISPYIGNYLNVAKTPLKSFKDVHRHIRYVQSIYIPDGIESGLLDLLKIRSLTRVKPIPYSQISSGPVGASEELKQAIGIINRQLMGSRDIHRCHEQLIEAGLGEFA